MLSFSPIWRGDLCCLRAMLSPNCCMYGVHMLIQGPWVSVCMLYFVANSAVSKAGQNASPGPGVVSWLVSWCALVWTLKPIVVTPSGVWLLRIFSEIVRCHLLFTLNIRFINVLVHYIHTFLTIEGTVNRTVLIGPLYFAESYDWLKYKNLYHEFYKW